jgi:AcrR family transcriptional regulator
MLREKQMAERRGRILDAAESLIRQTGGTDFPMLALAERAEVSPTTPYNLFGSKAGVLYALLNRTMDQINERTQSFSSANPNRARARSGRAGRGILRSRPRIIAEPDLQRALRKLADAELLYVRGIAPDANYQFKHALIRDAAYEALLKSRRKEPHRLVAHPEVLARHWT